MTNELKNESLMDESGLGLLPGIAGALGLVVGAMALLLLGSMWAVFGVLALALAVTVVLLLAVIWVVSGYAADRPHPLVALGNFLCWEHAHRIMQMRHFASLKRRAERGTKGAGAPHGVA